MRKTPYSLRFLPGCNDSETQYMEKLFNARTHIASISTQKTWQCSRKLWTIITATASALGRPVDTLHINAFSVPQHFYDISSFTNMVETASRPGYIYRTSQMITHFNNALLAYNLDSCAELGLPPDCNLDEEETYVFVIDYGTMFLSLGFAAVGKRLYAQIAERDWIDVELEVEDMKNSDNATAKLPTFALERIQDFLGHQLTRREGDVPILPPSCVLAVILTGEALDQSISAMKALAEEALPAFKPKFKISIEPGLVGAYGAAHRARQMVTDEIFIDLERLSDRHGFMEEERHPPLQQSHDEL